MPPPTFATKLGQAGWVDSFIAEYVPAMKRNAADRPTSEGGGMSATGRKRTFACGYAWYNKTLSYIVPFMFQVGA